MYTFSTIAEETLFYLKLRNSTLDHIEMIYDHMVIKSLKAHLSPMNVPFFVPFWVHMSMNVSNFPAKSHRPQHSKSHRCDSMTNEHECHSLFSIDHVQSLLPEIMILQA